MFSNFIQNLLNSGGQTQAMQRYAQIANRVNNLNPEQQTALDAIYPNKVQKVNTPSFEKVLQASSKSNFGTLLLDPKLKQVNATIVQPKVSQTNAIQEAITAQVNVKPVTSSKSQIMNVVSHISKKHGVDEKLVQALIKQESGFNPKAKSKSGAIGLMQLMPQTAKNLGVKDPYNTVQNVDGGVRYLKTMLDKYNGNVILALAAYNAGPGAVDKYSGVPPYKETQNYVRSILANYL